MPTADVGLCVGGIPLNGIEARSIYRSSVIQGHRHLTGVVTSQEVTFGCNDVTGNVWHHMMACSLLKSGSRGRKKEIRTVSKVNVTSSLQNGSDYHVAALRCVCVCVHLSVAGSLSVCMLVYAQGGVYCNFVFM